MAPTIHDEGYALQIYTHDHSPAHAHVKRDGREARIALAGPDGRPYALSSGLDPRELARGLELVAKHQAQLFEIWRTIHG